MAVTFTIAKRELTSFFLSPVAYVVLIVAALVYTFFFCIGYAPGMPATMQSAYWWASLALIVFVPAISMRLVSEELRSGTIEPLLTAPVSDSGVILGKWLGAMAFLIVLLLPLAVLVAVLAATATPDYGPILTGGLGLLLIGAFYMAIGTFISTFTQNQIIAFFVTFLPIVVTTVVLYFVSQAAFFPAAVREAATYANTVFQFEDFMKGLLDLKKIVYLVTGTALFLFLAVKALESRRWR